MNNMNKQNRDNRDSISAYDIYTFYLYNSRIIGFIWFFLTICFTICLAVVFASPNWIGDTNQSSNRGYFGLFKYCTRDILALSYKCFGTWTDFSTLPNKHSTKAAVFFVGFALLLSFLCVLTALLSIVVKKERIFHFCAWLQIISTVCLFVGVCIFPLGWNAQIIRSVCGQEADQYKLGTCSVRWPLVLASIAIFQIFLLSILASLLAGKQAPLLLKYASKNRTDAAENNNGPRTFIA